MMCSSTIFYFWLGPGDGKWGSLGLLGIWCLESEAGERTRKESTAGTDKLGWVTLVYCHIYTVTDLKARIKCKHRCMDIWWPYHNRDITRPLCTAKDSNSLDMCWVQFMTYYLQNWTICTGLGTEVCGQAFA